MLLRRVCLFCVFAVATVNMAFGQTGASGTVLGTITDTSGAILPNVKIDYHQHSNQRDQQRRVQFCGRLYRSIVTPRHLYGFSGDRRIWKTRTAPFTLTVDQKTRIDLSLKAGTVTETLEVTAQAVTLDTDSAALSQEISGEQVADLPLNGRNFMQLLLVGAGAVTVGGEQGTMRQGEGNAVSINGGRPEGNNYTLDGLVNTDQALMTPAVILSQDAIGEFKVQSGIYPAENGFGASQINIVSKGGTNSLHGTIYESNSNNAFDTSPVPHCDHVFARVKTKIPFCI